MSSSAVLIPYYSSESVRDCPEAEAAIVASPAGVLDLVIYFNSESEPSKDLPLHVYHVVAYPESNPFEAGSEEDPSKDDPSDAAEPQPTQAISSPPVQTAPILPVKVIPVPRVILRGTSHTLSVPLHRRKHQLSSYFTPSPSVSVGSSRKRCRSPTTFLHDVVSAPAILSHVAADRLPPRTRFIGSLTASHEDDTIEASVEDIIKPTTEATPEDDVHTLRDRLTTFKGVSTNLRKRVRSLELSELSLRNSLRTARAERAEMQFQVRTMSVKCRGLSAATIERLVNQRVADALAAQEANQNNKNGRGNRNRNEARNHNEVNEGVGGVAPVARACTYKDFLNGQPCNFSGIKGGVGSARWFKKMESVFHISNCATSSQDAIKMANGLMDQKVCAYAAKNKRKWENNPWDNRVQQLPFKRQNVPRAYTAGSNKKKGYAGSLPYCNNYKLHHEGPCTMRCTNCKKVDHFSRIVRHQLL
nr:reverse transcriptase domain-containing protein [Tanacetum cinerariifolium]